MHKVHGVLRVWIVTEVLFWERLGRSPAGGTGIAGRLTPFLFKVRMFPRVLFSSRKGHKNAPQSSPCFTRASEAGQPERLST
jgi:hypothetical protein